MRYFNAVAAARVLNISDKTIRRWVKKGKISAKRTQFNEIAIPESEIDRLRLELGSTDQGLDSLGSTARGGSLYSLYSPYSPYSIDRIDTSTTPDIEQRLASLAQSIANLNMAVDSQTRRITELTKRVAELEARSYPVIAENVPVLSTQSTQSTQSQHTTTTSTPQNRNVVPSDLPPGTLHSSEFADQLGIKRTVFDSMMKNGIGGEELERTKIPIAARPGTNKNWFTPSEQQKAIELLIKHGKLAR